MHGISGKFPLLTILRNFRKFPDKKNFCQNFRKFSKIFGNVRQKFPEKFCRNFCQKLLMSKKIWEVVQKIFWLFTKIFRKTQNKFSKKVKVLLQKGETFLGNPYRAKFHNFHDGVWNGFSGSFVFSPVTPVTSVQRLNPLRKNIPHFLYTLWKMFINCGDAVTFLRTTIFVKV